MQATAQVKPEKNTKAKQIENVVDKTFFHQVNSGGDLFWGFLLHHWCVIITGKNSFDGGGVLGC